MPNNFFGSPRDQSPTPILAGVVIDPPQAYPCILKEFAHEDKCKGRKEIGSNVEIFETMASLMNWDVTYVAVNSYGGTGANFSASRGGLAGAIQRAELNITATLMAMNPSNALYLDYSYPVTYLRFGLLAHPPPPTDISLLIIKPFDLSVWIVLGLMMVVSLLGIYIADRYKARESSRLLRDGLVAWLAFFIGAAYSCLIKACLLRKRQQLPFSNLEGLLKHTLENNGSYILLSEFNYWTASKKDFISFGTVGALGRRAKERGFIWVNKNLTQLLTRFGRDRRYVLWGDESRIYKGLIEFPGSVALFEDDFTQNSWLAFGLPKNSEWTSKINSFLPLLFEYASAVMTKYAEHFSLATMSATDVGGEEMGDVDSWQIPLSLGVLQGTVVIYLVGAGISILLVICEMILHWFTNRRGNVRITGSREACAAAIQPKIVVPFRRQQHLERTAPKTAPRQSTV